MAAQQRLPPLQGTMRASALSQFAVAEVSADCVARTTGLGCAAVIPATSARPSENLAVRRPLLSEANWRCAPEAADSPHPKQAFIVVHRRLGQRQHSAETAYALGPCGNRLRVAIC